MRRRLATLVAVAALSALLAVPGEAATSTNAVDPARWSDRRLAAQLVLAGVSMGSLAAAEEWARAGIGGIVLFGSPPASLGSRLARVRAAGSVVPFVASDEEGGMVQRLAPLIYRLPSAETMARTRSTRQVRLTALDYGERMRRLGVDMELAPVADLAVPGYYIERTNRGFSANPSTAGAYAAGWHAGMAAARVAAVAKHWPGHGQAKDSHVGLATTPPWSTVRGRDAAAFTPVLAAGVPAVMVGHLVVPGLTESTRTPTSLSPKAYAYLRSAAGADRLLVTDSLSMGAIRSGVGLSQPSAAVRALRAGADMVMVDGADPLATVRAVAAAITGGSYSRARAVASVRRVLRVKHLTTAPRAPGNPWPQARSAVEARTTLSAIVSSPVGGRLRLQVYLRNAGAQQWDVVNGANAYAMSGSRARYQPPPESIRPLWRYEWRSRTCNEVGRCSALSPIVVFSTV